MLNSRTRINSYEIYQKFVIETRRENLNIILTSRNLCDWFISHEHAVSHAVSYAFMALSFARAIEKYRINFQPPSFLPRDFARYRANTFVAELFDDVWSPQKSISPPVVE